MREISNTLADAIQRCPGIQSITVDPETYTRLEWEMRQLQLNPIDPKWREFMELRIHDRLITKADSVT
jgi:hypothetical protein